VGRPYQLKRAPAQTFTTTADASIPSHMDCQMFLQGLGRNTAGTVCIATKHRKYVFTVALEGWWPRMGFSS